MNSGFHLIYRKDSPASASPYRLLDPYNREVPWANDFLDAQHVRGLARASLRAYGYDLLNFSKWRQKTHSSLSRLNQSRLLAYVRYQLDSQPKPTPQTINHRLIALHCLYRFHYGCEIPHRRSSVLSYYKTRTPLGYGKPRHILAGLRLKQPRRVVVPLAADEVSLFWSSFRTFRDLSLVALMLFNGLRSGETLQIELEDLDLPQAQLRVRGKGNKERIVPLSDEIIHTIERYLRLERPPGNSTLAPLSKRPTQGSPHDARRCPLPVSPSPPSDKGLSGQPSSIPSYLRSGHGSSRCFCARPDEADGPLRH